MDLGDGVKAHLFCIFLHIFSATRVDTSTPELGWKTKLAAPILLAPRYGIGCHERILNTFVVRNTGYDTSAIYSERAQMFCGMHVAPSPSISIASRPPYQQTPYDE